MKDDQLLTDLLYLKLAYFHEHHQSLAREAVEKNWTPLDFLSRLAEGEALRRKDRATQRRLQAARFPVVKTLEQFNWAWPKKINRPHVQNLFRLSFLQDKANVIFMGGAGLGKTQIGRAHV
jgi:DNA replication protein DnaC